MNDSVNTNNDFPEEALDPVTLQIMDDPVMLETGHTFDRKTLKKIFPRRHPLTGENLDQLIFFPDLKVRELVEPYLSDKQIQARDAWWKNWEEPELDTERQEFFAACFKHRVDVHEFSKLFGENVLVFCRDCCHFLQRYYLTEFLENYGALKSIFEECGVTGNQLFLFDRDMIAALKNPQKKSMAVKKIRTSFDTITAINNPEIMIMLVKDMGLSFDTLIALHDEYPDRIFNNNILSLDRLVNAKKISWHEFFYLQEEKFDFFISNIYALTKIIIELSFPWSELISLERSTCEHIFEYVSSIEKLNGVGVTLGMISKLSHEKRSFIFKYNHCIKEFLSVSNIRPEKLLSLSIKILTLLYKKYGELYVILESAVEEHALFWNLPFAQLNNIASNAVEVCRLLDEGMTLSRILMFEPTQYADLLTVAEAAEEECIEFVQLPLQIIKKFLLQRETVCSLLQTGITLKHVAAFEANQYPDLLAVAKAAGKDGINFHSLPLFDLKKMVSLEEKRRRIAEAFDCNNFHEMQRLLLDKSIDKEIFNAEFQKRAERVNGQKLVNHRLLLFVSLTFNMKYHLSESNDSVLKRLPQSERTKAAWSHVDQYREAVLTAIKNYLDDQSPDKDNKKSLKVDLEAATNAFCHPKNFLKENGERIFLGEDRTSWSQTRREFMMVTVNFLLHVTIMGMILNVIHKAQTGNWFFFTTTKSQEKLNKMTKKIVHDIDITEFSSKQSKAAHAA